MRGVRGRRSRLKKVRRRRPQMERGRRRQMSGRWHNQVLCQVLTQSGALSGALSGEVSKKRQQIRVLKTWGTCVGRRRPRIGGAAMATLTRFNETIMVKVKRVGLKIFCLPWCYFTCSSPAWCERKVMSRTRWGLRSGCRFRVKIFLYHSIINYAVISTRLKNNNELDYYLFFLPVGSWSGGKTGADFFLWCSFWSTSWLRKRAWPAQYTYRNQDLGFVGENWCLIWHTHIYMYLELSWI